MAGCGCGWLVEAVGDIADLIGCGCGFGYGMWLWLWKTLQTLEGVGVMVDLEMGVAVGDIADLGGCGCGCCCGKSLRTWLGVAVWL